MGENAPWEVVLCLAKVDMDFVLFLTELWGWADRIVERSVDAALKKAGTLREQLDKLVQEMEATQLSDQDEAAQQPARDSDNGAMDIAQEDLSPGTHASKARPAKRKRTREETLEAAGTSDPEREDRGNTMDLTEG